MCQEQVPSIKATFPLNLATYIFLLTISFACQPFISDDESRIARLNKKSVGKNEVQEVCMCLYRSFVLIIRGG